MYVRNTLGDVTSFYKVSSITIVDEVTNVAVYPVGGDEITPDIYEVPEEALVGDTEESVGNWLVSNEGPYSGGEVLATSAYNLLTSQELKRAAIKARREAYDFGGLQTSFGLVQSDPASQIKITAAVVMADKSLNPTYAALFTDPSTGLPVPFSIRFRMADDQRVLLTAMEMVQLGLEVGQQVIHFQSVKDYFDDQVTAASTVAEVESIDVTVDWHTVSPA